MFPHPLTVSFLAVSPFFLSRIIKSADEKYALNRTFPRSYASHGNTFWTL
ncbi:Uncharacterized protein dnm_002820 [Desulfonema magnum]|uniref:Uncharacterized protein n=1 Tax=Desulfonema magnum TaxID=45655 RepID=A0A975BFE5_9BACT|nr:Uncharacterized protein dnm_002820 [Desulfonema magnum]